MTSRPLLVIFTGLPGTGKTSISRHVSRKLGLPLIAKDAIKEIMYDHIGIGDDAWSGKLARATIGIMQLMAVEQLQSGNSFIVESNYRPSLASQEFQELATQYPLRCVQVVCTTEMDTLINRVHERAKQDRHPGHNDNLDKPELRRRMIARLELGDTQPLDIPGSHVITVDTTDFSKVDMDTIAEQIRAYSTEPK